MSSPAFGAAAKVLWSAAETSERTGLCPKTLYNHTAPRGDLPAVRIGGRVAYDPRDVAAWIERHKTRPATAPEGGVA